MTNDEYRQLIAFLGERFDGIEAHLTHHDHEFVALSRRLDALKADMGGQFREVSGQIEALAGHYERLQQEYHTIVEALRRMEAAQSDDCRRRETLERRLGEVHEELAALRARVDELERRRPG